MQAGAHQLLALVAPTPPSRALPDRCRRCPTAEPAGRREHRAMEDQRKDAPLLSTTFEARRGWLELLLQRLRRETPAPFRDSDFENVEWGRSAFDPQPGGAD